MNKIVLVIAFVAGIAAFAGGQAVGRRFSLPFEAFMARVYERRRAQLAAANSLRDRERASERDRESARLAASQTNADRLAAHNKQAGENFVQAKNFETLKANHDISKSSNFQLTIIDQQRHDESSSIDLKRGNSVDAGSRFKTDQGVKRESLSEASLKAAADKEREREAARELEKESLLKAAKDNKVNQFEQAALAKRR